MELKINYDHDHYSRNLPCMLGSTMERYEEIRGLWVKTIETDRFLYQSQRIEWVISQLKDVQPCDLVIVGYMFG